jgi:hypothetical protein
MIMRKVLAATISSLMLLLASAAQAEEGVPASLTTDTVLETVKVGLADAHIVFTDGQTVLYSPSTGLAMKGEAFDYKKNVNLTQKMLAAKQGQSTDTDTPSISDKVETTTKEKTVNTSSAGQPTQVIPKVTVDLSGAAEVQRRARDVVNSLLPKDADPILPPQAATVDIPGSSSVMAPKKEPAKAVSTTTSTASKVKPSASSQSKGELTKDEQFKQELVNLHENLLKDEATILYQSPNEQYRITVFTDITCPYCRRFHRDEVPKLLDMGVTVRYLPYPRAGLDSDTARQMAGIFCSDNQQEMMSIAKKGQSVRRESTDCSPLFKLGHKIGQILRIPGTPTIFSQYGDFWPGLMKAENIVEALESHRAAN